MTGALLHLSITKLGFLYLDHLLLMLLIVFSCSRRNLLHMVLYHATKRDLLLMLPSKTGNYCDDTFSPIVKPTTIKIVQHCYHSSVDHTTTWCKKCFSPYSHPRNSLHVATSWFQRFYSSWSHFLTLEISIRSQIGSLCLVSTVCYVYLKFWICS